MKASAVLAADVSLRAGPISTAISHTAGKKTTGSRTEANTSRRGRLDSKVSTSLVAKVNADRGQH